jgi:hypothetical protein
VIAEFLYDWTDIQKLITIPKGSIFKLDDRTFASPRGLHLGMIILEGRTPVIPPEYYILKYEE